MKQLIWKELREQRWTPVFVALTVMTVILAWYAAAAWLPRILTDSGPSVDDAGKLSVNVTTIVLLCAICASGVFPGAAAFASEIGKGTDLLLATMPGGRVRSWWSKHVAGAVITVASCAGAFIAYALTIAIIYGPSSLHVLHDLFAGPFRAIWSTLCYLMFAMTGYAVTQLVSAVVDRALVAVIAGPIAAAFFVLGVFDVNAQLNWGRQDPSHSAAAVVIMLAIGCVTSFAASYRAVNRSDLSSMSTRSRQAGYALGVGVAVLTLVTVMVGVHLNWVNR